MATQNAIITQANFSTSWAMEYGNKKHSTKDSTHYLYICAPCWYIHVKANYAILGGSGIVQLCCDYYNGTTWVEGSRNEISGVNGQVEKYFAHNRDEGNLTASFHSEYPLWRIRYWTSRDNDNWSISFWAGGWGMAVKTSTGETINYPQNKLIYSRGRTGTDCMMHDSNTSNDDTNVLNNIFNSTNRRGSLILASDDSELVNIPWK